MERAVVAALVSLALPGFGHAMTRRRRPAIAWAIGCALSVLLVLFSVWFVYISLAVRLACAIDSFRVVWRDWHNARWIGALQAITLVVASISGGMATMSFEMFKIPSSSMYPTVLIGDYVYADKLTVRWRTPARGEIVVFRYPCDPQRNYIKRVVAVAGDTVEVRCNVLYVNHKAVDSKLLDANASYDDQDYEGRWIPRLVSRYRETLDGHSYDTFHDADRPIRDSKIDTLTEADSKDFPRQFAPSCHSDGFYDQRTMAPQPVGRLVVTKDPATAKPCEQQVHYVVPEGALFTLGDNRSNANDSRFWGAVATQDVIGRLIGVWYSRGENGLDLSRIGHAD